MSWLAVQFVRDLEGDFSSSEMHVLLILATHHNEQTGECNPSTVKIAKQSRMKRDTVSKAIKNLAEKGVIRIDRPSNGGCANRYFFTTLGADGVGVSTCPENGTATCPENGTPPKNEPVPFLGMTCPDFGHDLSQKRDTKVKKVKKVGTYLPSPLSSSGVFPEVSTKEFLGNKSTEIECPIETFMSVWNETLGDVCGEVSANEAARSRDVLTETWAWYRQSEAKEGRVATPSKMADELRGIISETVLTSDFLLGRSSANGRPFRLRFAWLMKTDTLVGLANGHKTY